jgi:hypothetical protein
VRTALGQAVEITIDLAPSLPEPVSLLAISGSADHVAPMRRASSTTASGSAWRFSHQAGSAAPQPFIAIVTRLGPSSK